MTATRGLSMGLMGDCMLVRRARYDLDDDEERRGVLEGTRRMSPAKLVPAP
jgi:hypothetical protein